MIYITKYTPTETPTRDSVIRSFDTYAEAIREFDNVVKGFRNDGDIVAGNGVFYMIYHRDSGFVYCYALRRDPLPNGH